MLSGYLWDTGAGLSRDSIDGILGTVTAPGDYQVLDITASHTLSPEIENCTHWMKYQEVGDFHPPERGSHGGVRMDF